MEIKLDNVSYKDVLNNINLQFKDKTINGICGISGSGKTTLLELIANLIEPTEGKIYVGKKYINKSNRKNIKMVFQNPEEQFFCKTVLEEITFNSDKKDLDKVLETLKIDKEILNNNPYSLSSGEMRKVAIASILIFSPKVLILDEPTIGLDNKAKENLIDVIRNLKNNYDKTIIISSKDTDFLLSVCDNVSVLYNNSIVLDGNKYDVLNKVEQFGLKKPKIIEFQDIVLKEKNIKLLNRDEINDLMKDVYRHVS